MDANKDGFVERAEFSDALQRLGVPPEAAARAAELADFDNDGQIEWSEFVANCLPTSHELFAVSLQVAFDCFDADHDGVLDRGDVERLLASGKIESLHMPTTKTVEAMLDELDADRNGTISFKEFHDYFVHAADADLQVDVGWRAV